MNCRFGRKPRAFGLWLALLFASQAWALDAVDDLIGPWQLLVDDYPVASKTNVIRTYHPFQKYAGNPVLVVDKPWEGLVYLYGTVLPNETRTGYRMWYHTLRTNSLCSDASLELYATSTNGINWVKPTLNLRVGCGSTSNNMYFTRPDAGGITSVMQTPWDPDPNQRYKFMNYGGGGYYGAWSSNGINVVDAPGNPVFTGGSDVGQFSWDPHSQLFRGYCKNAWYDWNGLKRRAVALTTTTNIAYWPTESLILWPDTYDDRWSANPIQRTHFYGLSAFAYENMYLGFLWIFRGTNLTSSPAGYEGYLTGPCFVELVSSHDGVQWTRQEAPRPPILPLGPNGSWDDGMVFTARAPLVEGDTIKLWYGGFDQVHGIALNQTKGSIGLATLRKDGFASLDAGATAGIIVTKSLAGAAGALKVNYQVAGGGSLKVEVLDANNNVLPGYSQADCVALTGNSITQAVTWAAHLELPASPAFVRLRFILQNGSLYSFMAGDTAKFAEPPAITQQPVDRVVVAGGVTTFDLLATATPSPAYRWQKNHANLFDGGNYSGCGTATLTLSNAQTNDAASYRCVVTNLYGSITSNPAMLTVATNPIGGITLRSIPLLPGDSSNEGRALSPDARWVTGVSGSRGFIYNTQTTNLFNVVSADNAQATALTGLGYRTQAGQQEIVVSGLASNAFSTTNWFTVFMTTNGTSFANKVQISGGTIKVPVLPLANGLAGTSSNVFYATWSDNNASDYQEYVGRYSNAWPVVPQWDIKGIPKPTPAGMNGISSAGRAVGWRGNPKASYVLDWNGGGSTSPWFFTGLDGTTAGEALAVSADGTEIYGRSPVLDGRPGSWGYKKTVAATMPGPAAELSVDELPNFLDTDGASGSAAAPYGCTADGKFAVGTSYRGLETAVLWDTRDSNPARWTVTDLTTLAQANGGLNSFTRLVRAYSVVSNAGANLTITGYGLDGSGSKRAFIMTVPPPSAPVVTITGSYLAGFTFTFTSLGNRNLTNYLEYTTTLNPPNTWNTITSAPCSGVTTILSDPNPTGAQRFYRIRIE